jgi:hypothetical protein
MHTCRPAALLAKVGKDEPHEQLHLLLLTTDPTFVMSAISPPSKRCLNPAQVQ